MNLELANILENILLFDRVYIEAMILPVVIDMMYKQDYKGTIKLIKKGYISFIDYTDISISATSSDKDFVLSLGVGKKYDLDTVKKLEDFILAYRVRKDKLRPYISRIFDNKKTIDIDVAEFGKIIVHKVDSEIKSGIYSKIGIGLNGNYAIDSSNKGIFDVICQLVRSESIASASSIKSISHKDIVLEVSKIRSNINRSTGENFNELITLNDIPDICSLYIEGDLSILDIVELKSSSEFKAFKKWFESNEKCNKDDIIKNYYLATKKKSKLDSVPVRVMRFVATGAAGLVPGIGTIASFVDSFGVDLLNNIYNTLLYYADKISNDNNEAKCIEYFTEAKGVYEKLQTKKTLEAYLYCMVNMSNKSKIYCREFIERIGEYIKCLRKKDIVGCMDIVQDSYVSILLNGISQDLELVAVDKMRALVDNEVCMYKMTKFIKHIITNGSESDIEYIKKLAIILLYSIGRIDQIYSVEAIGEVSITDLNEIRIVLCR
ncbi:MAG: hypothetical protein ACRCXT_12805 [Paraclostridium sp.]